MDRQDKLVCFFAVLFGLPFCLFGLAALAKGAGLIAGGFTGPRLLLMPFGLLFFGAGAAVIAGAFWASSKSAQQRRMQAENPSSPWLWRTDWADGRCDSKTKSTMISAWAIAFIWNVISITTVFFIPIQAYRQKPLTLLALIFPALGIWLLVRAVRQTIAWSEFGKTCFQMTGVPAVIGREMRGAIQARFPKPPDHGIRLKLSCVNRIVSGSGRDQSSRENILWRDEHTVSPAELYASPTGTTVPVSFHIPLDARQTDYTNSQNAIFWILEADADVPGVDYQDVFELPVFRTKDSPAKEEEERFAQAAINVAPPAPSIVVTPTGEGTQFYFPRARNKGFAAGTTAFFLLWSGTLALILRLHAPFIFPLVFGLFDLLLFYVVLQMWFGTSTVIANHSGLRVRAGLFGTGQFKEIAPAEVSTIETAIRSQTGGATGTPYYDIVLTRTNGRKVTLGQTIRDKQEAEWLVSEMLQCVKPKAKAAGN